MGTYKLNYHETSNVRHASELCALLHSKVNSVNARLAQVYPSGGAACYQPSLLGRTSSPAYPAFHRQRDPRSFSSILSVFSVDFRSYRAVCTLTNTYCSFWTPHLWADLAPMSSARIDSIPVFVDLGTSDRCLFFDDSRDQKNTRYALPHVIVYLSTLCPGRFWSTVRRQLACSHMIPDC